MDRRKQNPVNENVNSRRRIQSRASTVRVPRRPGPADPPPPDELLLLAAKGGSSNASRGSDTLVARPPRCLRQVSYGHLNLTVVIESIKMPTCPAHLSLPCLAKIFLWPVWSQLHSLVCHLGPLRVAALARAA